MTDSKQTDRVREIAKGIVTSSNRKMPCDGAYFEGMTNTLVDSFTNAILSFSKAESELFELYENTLKLIAVPKLQDKYTPQQLAKHALRMEALKP